MASRLEVVTHRRASSSYLSASFLPSFLTATWLTSGDSRLNTRPRGNTLHRLLHQLSHTGPSLAPVISSKFYSFDGFLTKTTGPPDRGGASSPRELSIRAVACPPVLDTECLLRCFRGIRNSQTDPESESQFQHLP